MTTLPAQAIALPALSSNSLGSYIQAVGRIPALTREQEIALFERYQQDEDLDAVVAPITYIDLIITVPGAASRETELVGLVAALHPS